MGEADRLGFAGGAGGEHDPADVGIVAACDLLARERRAFREHPVGIGKEHLAGVLERSVLLAMTALTPSSFGSRGVRAETVTMPRRVNASTSAAWKIVSLT